MSFESFLSDFQREYMQCSTIFLLTLEDDPLVGITGDDCLKR
ncbi:hypothetical protein [Prochlorococcus marinus]|nr:hypothetical protein [Prochlorococcus marinus]